MQNTQKWPVFWAFSPRSSEFGTEVQSAMVHAANAYKLHGNQGLKTVLDPCGNGPFTLRRIIVEGIDRGFELKSSSYRSWNGSEEVLFFAEKAGKPVVLHGPMAGQPVLDQAETMRLTYGLPRPAGSK